MVVLGCLLTAQLCTQRFFLPSQVKQRSRTNPWSRYTMHLLAPIHPAGPLATAAAAAASLALQALLL
jgi:hypothetical protein